MNRELLIAKTLKLVTLPILFGMAALIQDTEAAFAEIDGQMSKPEAIQSSGLTYWDLWLESTKLRYAEKLTERSMQAAELQDMGAALDLAEIGSRLSPDDPGLHMLRAGLYKAEGRLEEALQAATRAYQLDSEQTDTLPLPRLKRQSS